MRVRLFVVCAISLLLASEAAAKTRSPRAARAYPPPAAPADQAYPSANTQWPQRPVASGSYGAMLEGRNPASSASF